MFGPGDSSPHVGVSSGERPGRMEWAWPLRWGRASRRAALSAHALAGPAMAAPGEQLRRRKAADAGLQPESSPGPGHDPAGFPARLRAGTFWLTRIVLLRALAFVYCESAGLASVGVTPPRAHLIPPVTLPRPVPRPRVHSGASSHVRPRHCTCTPLRGCVPSGPGIWLRFWGAGRGRGGR